MKKDSTYRSDLSRQIFLLPKNFKVLQAEGIDPAEHKLLDFFPYVKKEISGVGGEDVSFPLLTSDEPRKIGLREFVDGKLPKGVFATVLGIRVEWATDSTQTDPTKLLFSNLIDDGTAAVDAALANAMLEIRQQNELHIEIPVENLLAQQLSRGPKAEEFYILRNKFMLIPELPVLMNLRFGAAVDGTAKWHIKVELMGDKIVKK